jgi:hypothetical protein
LSRLVAPLEQASRNERLLPKGPHALRGSVEGQEKVTVSLPIFIFAMDVDGKATFAFEAKNLREASELCKEVWLRADLSALTSNGIPLCTAVARMTVRRATESEMQVYRDADREAQASDDLLLAYLVELDGPGTSAQ